ncbi:MAG: hypothetical protein RRZ24_07250 [Clostridia bacterium]
MREYWILTRLQLSSLFGINQLIHMKDGEEKKKRRRNLWVLAVMVVSLVYISVFYSFVMSKVLAPLGALDMMLGTMGLAAAMLVLMFSIFETKGVLFGFGDYDTVMSWPVSVRAVATSRLTTMYVYNLVYAALLLLPAGVIYAVKAGPAWRFYPVYLICILCFTALPTVLGAMVGTLITVTTAHMKKNSMLNAAFQMIFVAALMFFIMRVNMGMDNLDHMILSLQGKIARIYPPALWLQNAAAGGDVAGLLWTVLSAAAGVVLLTILLARGFVRLNSRLSAAPRGKRFSMVTQKRSSIVRALYRKEWKRYMSSSSYVVNTAFGYVMLLALAVVIGIVKPAAVMKLLNTPELSALRMALPMVMTGIIAMSTTTDCSISMEGRNIWIIQSMPVCARDWLLSKLLVSLTLAIPLSIISAAIIAVGLNATLTEWLFLMVTPIVFALFSAVLGLFINLLLPKLDWKNEVEVVKQSTSVMIAKLDGMMLVLGLAGVLIATGAIWLLLLSTLVALVISALVWACMCKNGDRRLHMMRP